jgi:hypothetical protein
MRLGGRTLLVVVMSMGMMREAGALQCFFSQCSDGRSLPCFGGAEVVRQNTLPFV